MLTNNIVRQKDVERLIGYRITTKQFMKALKYARQKQECIYKREKREEVLQREYLVKLTAEYARYLAFSKFTMDLSSFLHDMEKEHSVKNQSAPTDNHIVAGSVL